MHKVQPVYPAEARRMHVEGSVVIDAVVNVARPGGRLEAGERRSAAGAGSDGCSPQMAVQRPTLLNGKPIPKETRITISFIAPQ